MTLHVTVHNIGSADAANASLALFAELSGGHEPAAGVQLGEQPLGTVAHPADLMPKTVAAAFLWTPGPGTWRLVAEVECDAPNGEVNSANNVAATEVVVVE
jgi:hypothetical protein